MTRNGFPGGGHSAGLYVSNGRGATPLRASLGVKRVGTTTGSTVPNKFRHNIINNQTVPVGAGIVGRSLVQHPNGKVMLNRKFYFGGALHSVTQQVHTVVAPTVQGVAIPVTKLQQMLRVFNAR